MKKLLVIIALSGTMFASCNSTNQAEQEKQDSIAAAATADSLLQATLAADTVKAVADSIKAE